MAKAIHQIAPARCPVQHVYPVPDVREHETNGTECWCLPSVQLIRTGISVVGCVVVHNESAIITDATTHQIRPLAARRVPFC